MDYTYINFDTTNWYHDYYMMWDDPAQKNGDTFSCGKYCTQHRLFVRSKVNQKVRIGAHTYNFYTYPDALGRCPVRTNDPQLDDVGLDTMEEIFEANETPNVIMLAKGKMTTTFTDGSGWLGEVNFEAGE